VFIERYKYRDIQAGGWEFDEFRFRNSNLLVGKTGAGKTRVLNTIFSLGTNIGLKDRLQPGSWDLSFSHDSYKYRYALKVSDGRVEHEHLQQLDSVERTPLIQVDERDVRFKGQKLPSLARDRTLVATLQEDESITPVFKAFGSICRRNFDRDALDRARAFGNIPKKLQDDFSKSGFQPMAVFDLPLATRLFLLQQFKKEVYKRITDTFSEVFSDILSYQIRKLKREEVPIDIDGVMPMLFLSEKNVAGQVPLAELSSGMIKVMLIVTDVLTAPEGTVYLIDEYENSLGVNAIGFLPDLLVKRAGRIQTIVTTHHPFLINVMPIEDWHILHRTGSRVSVTQGIDRRERYMASTQEAFVQLLNDPAYASED
jgi:hypothetical protein